MEKYSPVCLDGANFNMNVGQLGTQRQNAHPTGTQRYYADPNKEDTIGIAGEIAFGKIYNLKPDLTIKPLGDDHIDFKIKINGGRIATIDVKTAQKAYNLLIKKWEIEKCADVLVLAQYLEGKINFIGWTTRHIMSIQPTKVFSSLGIENYYLHRDNLNQMETLDRFFAKHQVEQIF